MEILNAAARRRGSEGPPASSPGLPATATPLFRPGFGGGVGRRARAQQKLHLQKSSSIKKHSLLPTAGMHAGAGPRVQAPGPRAGGSVAVEGDPTRELRAAPVSTRWARTGLALGPGAHASLWMRRVGGSRPKPGCGLQEEPGLPCGGLGPGAQAPTLGGPSVRGLVESRGEALS